MDALQFFLREHARVHSASVGQPEGFSLEDVILDGLTDDQIRHRPQEGLNSLAWLTWHMARTEDVAINTVLTGAVQVLEDDDWLQRLNLSRHDIGTGMADDEVSDFSANVDLGSLRAYRAAVGKRTREVVARLRSEEWEEVIDQTQVARALSQGAFTQRGAWVSTFWQGKTKAFLLGQTAIAYNAHHFGEAWCIRSLAGLRLPF